MTRRIDTSPYSFSSMTISNWDSLRLSECMKQMADGGGGVFGEHARFTVKGSS